VLWWNCPSTYPSGSSCFVGGHHVLLPSPLLPPSPGVPFCVPSWSALPGDFVLFFFRFCLCVHWCILFSGLLCSPSSGLTVSFWSLRCSSWSAAAVGTIRLWVPLPFHSLLPPWSDTSADVSHHFLVGSTCWGEAHCLSSLYVNSFSSRPHGGRCYFRLEATCCWCWCQVLCYLHCIDIAVECWEITFIHDGGTCLFLEVGVLEATSAAFGVPAFVSNFMPFSVASPLHLGGILPLRSSCSAHLLIAVLPRYLLTRLPFCCCIAFLFLSPHLFHCGGASPVFCLVISVPPRTTVCYLFIGVPSDVTACCFIAFILLLVEVEICYGTDAIHLSASLPRSLPIPLFHSLRYWFDFV